MAEQLIGRKVKLTFEERKTKTVLGEVLEINDLGIVFKRDDYRNSGSRSELVLRDDIVAIAEPMPKKGAAKKATTKPAVAEPEPEPVPEPPTPSADESSDDFVNDDDFSDEDDLDFDDD